MTIEESKNKAPLPRRNVKATVDTSKKLAGILGCFKHVLLCGPDTSIISMTATKIEIKSGREDWVIEGEAHILHPIVLLAFRQLHHGKNLEMLSKVRRERRDFWMLKQKRLNAEFGCDRLLTERDLHLFLLLLLELTEACAFFHAEHSALTLEELAELYFVHIGEQPADHVTGPRLALLRHLAGERAP